MTPRPLIVSPGQAKVLREFLRDGATNKVIGQRLFVTEDTVKTHMKRLFEKAGVHDRAALAVAVLRGQIVPAVRIFQRSVITQPIDLELRDSA